MKIVQVISTPPFAWATGGPARVVYELSKELVKRGQEITLLTTDIYEPKQRYVSRANPEYLEGMQVFRFRCISNWLAWKHKIFIAPGLIMHLRSHLREYDVVHLQDILSVHAIASAKYCKKYGIPYVLTTHGSIPRLNERRGLAWLFDKVGGSKIIGNASKLIALTPAEAKQYKNIGVSENKIEIVPHGIDLSEFENLPQKGGFKRKHNLNDNQRIVLYLGRIHQIKGLDLLVKAFVGLSIRVDSAKLVIIGPDDGYLDSLKELVADLEIGDKVLFTGPLYGQEKLQAYVDADVYVLPSSYEIFGLTVLEACACGTPVVVTEACGLAEWIDQRAGFKVTGDEHRLQEAVRVLLNNEELRRQLGDRARELVREQFSWHKAAQQVEKIYTQLLSYLTTTG